MSIRKVNRVSSSWSTSDDYYEVYDKRKRIPRIVRCSEASPELEVFIRQNGISEYKREPLSNCP